MSTTSSGSRKSAAPSKAYTSYPRKRAFARIRFYLDVLEAQLALLERALRDNAEQ